MNVLVLSDTHMPSRAKRFPPMLVAAFEQANLILHAGDMTTAWVLQELRRYALVVGVAGNNDDEQLCAELPRTALVSVGRFRVGVVHGDGPGGSTFSRAAGAFPSGSVDCVVFGHSHQPLNERRGSVLYLNPGSPTDRRREPRLSFAWLRAGETLEADHVFFESKS